VSVDHGPALIAALPQEPPFRFVDAVTRHEPPNLAEGLVTFPADHGIFRGHLPNQPIVPGVILLEALAQLSALVILELPLDPNARVRGYLAGVSHLRYYRRVGPDEPVELRSQLDRKLGSAAKFEVEAHTGGERVLRGVLTVGGMNGP
jgi:3-hydroxyacyl-[acyl-carrier-protein] dehydratase